VRVASLRRRFLAAVLDVGVVIIGMAAVVGMGIAAALASARVRGPHHEDEPVEAAPPAAPTIQEFRLSLPLRVALWLTSLAVGVIARDWRSPGARVLGLRRVDARTGGPVTAQSALIGSLFELTRQELTRLLFRTEAQGERARRDALRAQLGAIGHTHAADTQACQQAVTEFHQTNEFNPLATCGRAALGPVISQVTLAVAIQDGRTMYDRLTGTIVITDL
jgi:hypothetical protein